MQDLTYDSHRPFRVLGSLGVMLGLYLGKVVVFFLVVKPISRISLKVIPLMKKMEKQLFYSDILIILIEGYLEFLIATYLGNEIPE